MLIKTQLRVAVLVTVAGLIAGGTLLAVIYQKARQAEEVRAWATAVVRAVFECNMFGSEIAIQESERAWEQYTKSSDRLAGLLAAPPARGVEAKPLREFQDRKTRMDRVVARFGSAQASASGPRDPQLEEEFKNLLASQTLLHAEAMLNAATRFREQASLESTRLWGINVFWGAAMIFFILAGTAAILTFFYRRVLMPLESLAGAARRVGAGDLNAQVSAPYPDELGTVARTFNAMTSQLQQRETELKERIRDLDTLCYSIAHDLKAPLRAVEGFGQLLQEDHGPAIGADGQSYIDRMLVGTRRMDALIDGLLQYGTLTHRDLEIGPVDLEGVWREVLSDGLKHDAQQRGASLQRLEALPMVLGHALVLRTALHNLISNALKYGRPEGAMVTVRAETSGSEVILYVEDNGIGIAPEHQAKIFGLFERLHSQEDYEGTGLGLAMVKRGIERLGGRITVRSQPGLGSVFAIHLRAASAKSGSGKAA